MAYLTKECLKSCPKCGAYCNNLVEENFSGDEVIFEFYCDECGTVYFEHFQYGYSGYDENQDND